MEFAQKLMAITENIRKIRRITSHNDGNENEVQALSHGLVDIEEAIKGMGNLINELYASVLPEQEVEEILIDIGDHLRHIVYHVRDTKYYEYLDFDTKS